MAEPEGGEAGGQERVAPDTRPYRKSSQQGPSHQRFDSFIVALLMDGRTRQQRVATNDETRLQLGADETRWQTMDQMESGRSLLRSFRIASAISALRSLLSKSSQPRNECSEAKFGPHNISLCSRFASALSSSTRSVTSALLKQHAAWSMLHGASSALRRNPDLEEAATTTHELRRARARCSQQRRVTRQGKVATHGSSTRKGHSI